MSFGRIIPTLRSFDEAKAKEFYVGFLEFKVDWEHHFEDNTPLYMQISKDGCVIHLSEHHGRWGQTLARAHRPAHPARPA